MNKEKFCLLISPVFNPGKGNLLMMVREQDPPLNLAMLAAWVRNNGFDTAILDCAIDAPTLKLFRKKMAHIGKQHSEKKIYVGFYVCTPTAYTCYELMKVAREIIPSALIIAGGPHATFMYEEVLTMAPADMAIIGEGERTLEEILRENSPESINGIAYKKENAVFLTPPRERMCLLDELPMPAYDLLKVRHYRPPIGTFKKLPSFMLSFSRGCPNNCFFCTKTLGHKYFQKSAPFILKEIEYLYNNFSVKDFVFVDDTFTAFRDNAVNFCNLLIESNIKITWHCYTRIDSIDKELVLLMKKAGCHQLMFGVESFDHTVLNSINKNINPDSIEKAVKITKEAGIACRLSMMIGNKGDTKESLNHSLNEILRLKPDFISVLIATPGPGTPFFEWAEKENRFITKDWSLYTGGTPVVHIDGLSSQDISLFYKIFWKKFYFNSSTILRLLKYTTNMYQIYNLWVGFLRIIKFVIIRK